MLSGSVHACHACGACALLPGLLWAGTQLPSSLHLPLAIPFPLCAALAPPGAATTLVEYYLYGTGGTVFSVLDATVGINVQGSMDQAEATLIELQAGRRGWVVLRLQSQVLSAGSMPQLSTSTMNAPSQITPPCPAFPVVTAGCNCGGAGAGQRI